MACLTLTATAFVVLVFLHTVLASTDMYGTRFIFPQPICSKIGMFFKVQMVPRGYDPVIVEFTNKVEITGRGYMSSGNIYYGDLRNGMSSTIFIQCVFFEQEERQMHGGVSVVATGEILLHVLYKNDSFSVLPLNALGTSYTTLSFIHEDFDTFFVTITAPSALQVVIRDPGGQEHTTQMLNDEVYTYTSDASLTGVTVTSSKPIFVISGIFHSAEPGTRLVEHMRPDNTWGRHYVMLVPFIGKEYIKVLLSAYAPGPKISVTVKARNIRYFLSTDGQVLILNMLEDGHLVEISSPVRSFLLLFMLSTPYFVKNIVHGQKPLRYQYSLLALVSIAPVEQYMSDPCRQFQLNVVERTVLVAGQKTSEENAGKLSPLVDSHLLSTEPYWVRVVRNITILDFGHKLNNTPRANRFRFWFHDLTLLRRSYSLYLLEGGSYVGYMDPACDGTPKISEETTKKTLADDRVDNDCDGLVDEEMLNGVDDDGDGLIDEDISDVVLHDCFKDRRAYLWEPNRYRLTRYESSYNEFARRLPLGYTNMVLISAFVGVGMVFVFIFCVGLFDFIERVRYPHIPPHVF